MKATSKQRMEHLTNELQRGWKLHEEGKPDQARDIYHRILAELERAGLSSAFALWHLAMAHDRMEEFEMAFDCITRALAQDPLARPLRGAFDTIAARMRESLADGARVAGDPSTPRLYDLLVRSGEADLSSHLSMVRWCSATGDHRRARAISGAMTTLFPLDREAWVGAAEAARASGDHDAAVRAVTEASALEGAPIPFAVQAVARG